MMLTAVEVLSEARSARSAGDVEGCLLQSAAALGFAVDAHDAQTAFLAACMPGRMYLNRGEPENAESHFRHGLDIALYGGLAQRLPEVYHDLFVVARDRGDEGARRYHACAMELYLDTNGNNRRISALVADAAESRFMRRPCAETAGDALQAWRSVPASIETPLERLIAGCSMMVSAAYLGIACRYKDGGELVTGAFPRLVDYEGVALALAYGAAGAVKARDFLRASYMAAEAVRIAVVRGEGVAEARAREVLGMALAERTNARPSM